MITHGAQNYQIAFKKELYSKSNPQSVHDRDISSGGLVHNNKMERMNGEARDREKVLRGLRGMDTLILKGVQIHHNFIKLREGHQGMTPADTAGTKIEGEDMRGTLVQDAVAKKKEGEE